MKKNDLLKVAYLIQDNIQQYGLRRYDPQDISHLRIISESTCSSRLLRRMVLLLEEFCPIKIRKILRVEKKIFITAYTTLSNGYFSIEKNLLDFDAKFKSFFFMDKCLSEYINNYDENKWWYYKNTKKNKSDISVNNKKPTMPLHGLARCNISLLTIGLFYKNNNYIEIAKKSALLVLKNHQIVNYGNGCKSISYFYNSLDCTLNVNSEFAHWLSMLPFDKHNIQTLDMMYSIINLLISEQNSNGSWYYFSRWHMDKYKDKKSCDCHHSATVLYNLINILKCKYLDEKYRENIKYSLVLGMRYFISAFFDMSSGKGITEIGLKRPAGPVQYSEAIFAFCDYLTLDEVLDLDIQNQIFVLLPKVVDQLCNLVNMKDGSAPSKKVIKWVNINSIRWGNGPVFQAIMMYLSIYDMVNKDRNEDDGNY